MQFIDVNLLWNGYLAESNQRHYGGQGTHSRPRFGMGTFTILIKIQGLGV